MLDQKFDQTKIAAVPVIALALSNQVHDKIIPNSKIVRVRRRAMTVNFPGTDRMQIDPLPFGIGDAKKQKISAPLMTRKEVIKNAVSEDRSSKFKDALSSDIVTKK